MSAVKDALPTRCTFGHDLLRDFAVREGNDGVRHCRMCELQVLKASCEREMRKIEGQP